MPIVAGSVTVSSNEVASGTGMAKTIYDADVATLTLPTTPTLNSTAAPWRAEKPVSQADVDAVKAARLELLQDAARRATAYAAGVVAHLQANGIGT